MKFFNRWWWVCVFGVCAAEVHLNVPRWLRLFSRGPSDEKYEGKNVLNHIDNVLKGGTVGVEVDAKKHLGTLVKLWAKLRDGVRRLRAKKSRAEDRELEEEERIDPRKKWPPSRLVDRDSEILMLSRPRDDPDSEIVRSFGTRDNEIPKRDRYRSDPDR